MSLTLTAAGNAIARVQELRTLVAPSGFDRLLDQAATTPAPVAVQDAPHPTTLSRSSEPLPPGAQRWMGAIQTAAHRNGIDPDLLTAVVWTESSFMPDAVSHAGAVGLAQLMPDTARALDVDPFDPIQNLDGGARYLREMIDRFGRVDLALAAYNAGPTRLTSLLDGSGAVPISQNYVNTVLDRTRSLGADS